MTPPASGPTTSTPPGDETTLTVAAGTTPARCREAMRAASFWIGPLLQKLSYDPIRDFTPVTLAAFTPNVVVIYPALAATSTACAPMRAMTQSG